MRLPGWLTENFWLKGLSFLIAFVLWVFVRVEEKAELVMRLPVQYTDVPEELVIVGDPVPEIQLVVDGPRTLLTQANQNVRPYTVSLEGAEEGSQQVRIRPEKIDLPRGVEVVRVLPSLIETSLAPAMRKRLPVRARLVGDLVSGYEISSVELEPERIEVVAARSELQERDAILTEGIDIEGRKSDWSGIVNLDLDGLHVKSITTRQAEVYVEVVPKMVERTIEEVPVAVRGVEDGYRLEPSAITIRVMGPQNLLEKMSAESIRGYVEMRSPLRTATERSVVVDLPDQAVLLSVSPDRVRVVPES